MTTDETTDGTTDGTTGAGAAAPSPASEPSPAPEAGRTPLHRRLLRGRTARVVAASALASALVGGLLGAGVVAWRTDTLPLVGPDACWDTLDSAAVDDVLRGAERVGVEEEALRGGPDAATGTYGTCRLTAWNEHGTRYRGVVAQVRRLDSSDSPGWPREYLTSRMVPLGAGLPGMVSPNRAWLTVPEECVGRAEGAGGSTVVELSRNERVTMPDFPDDSRQRDALARAAVAVTNGVIRELGCEGVYPQPRVSGVLPARADIGEDFCGIPGLRVPAGYRKQLTWATPG
ncbi:hypothetical protein [Streptomyces sp. NPDC005805]|uniref:hypothetical protein n=1 Tax=Streptomyces sp. NPDC005805 TaxID=3157068 RepID=UPI0034070C5C